MSLTVEVLADNEIISRVKMKLTARPDPALRAMINSAVLRTNNIGETRFANFHITRLLSEDKSAASDRSLLRVFGVANDEQRGYAVHRHTCQEHVRLRPADSTKIDATDLMDSDARHSITMATMHTNHL
jgi:hypothetical protein